MDLTTGAGLLVAASVLGVTHGIEPDHVAGISALTHEVGDPRLSALVGGCFAVGHAALVVVWIALAMAVFGTTSFPPMFEQIGMVFVGVVLGLLSLYLGLTGSRKLLHRHRHDHDEGPHAHYHLHLPAFLRPATEGHGEHSHDHDVFAYLKIGTVGALFTLSPPVSMIGFVSITMAGSTPAVLTGVVAAYTVAIVATMTIVGGGAGALFRLTKERGERLHAVSQIVASVLVLAFAVNVLATVVPSMLS